MMKKLIYAAVITGSLSIASCSGNDQQGADHEKTDDPVYQNPVFEPVLADPSIIKGKDGYFYAYGTEDNWGDGWGPRYIPVVKSKDLVEWEYIGEAFEAVKKPNWKEGGLWAPDIVYHDGHYLLYYSMSTWGDEDPGIGVATSDTPEGPFEDQGPLFRSNEIGVENSIDSFFYNDNGTPYLFWGSFHGIYAIELEKDGLKVKGEPVQIAGNAFEAPYIIKRGEYYYFFGSVGSCCEGADSTYHVGAGRSKSLLGPYVDKSGNELMNSEGTPILTRGEQFAGPGHNAVVTDDKGTDWIVYHAIDIEEPKLVNGVTRRPLMIDPLIWKDGWPTIKDQVPGERKIPAPAIK
ncbi:family 43 glycosylhydrolase [Mesobacillus subterraneus]|uniref:family 43 glycosylhydrolase n=1 Tax=Mesobacillus subterraneus TaxID=285983 RepID=UPI00203FFAC3|nr:family 43 glycosylhydrolase [Mesobacillus subterraneus]MCM3574457.1 family 43 glycosylhydrolase [Mesobacillus subterraneus]